MATRKYTRPEYYKAPLKSRQAIIAWLMDHESYSRIREFAPIAWDVKCHNDDLSAEHLIEVYKASGEYGKDEIWLDSPEWRRQAMEKYKESEDRLFDYAIEDARRGFEDDGFYSNLWNGTELKVEYEFTGRSGGWLIISSFEGVNLLKMDRDGFGDWLAELEFGTLRNLYELVVQNDHDLRKEAVKNSIEFNAADTWINRLCVDIPRPDTIQLELPLPV